jgi:hypothetical protein
MMDGLEGICPKCGARYYGWALSNPRYQMCGKCGVSLDILRNGVKIGSGYSPFTAKEYKYGSQGEEKKEKESSEKQESPPKHKSE